MNAETLYGLSFALVFIGVAIIVVATLWFIFSSAGRKGETRGGGIIIIGPVPIVFGTDKESVRKVLLLSLALTIVLVIMMLVYYFVLR
jgi:uncharacterized protein (TIGR00304 family)